MTVPSFQREHGTRPGVVVVIARPDSPACGRVAAAGRLAALDVAPLRMAPDGETNAAMWAAIQTAEIVVSVLADASPEVWLWTGVASVLGKKQLLLARADDDAARAVPGVMADPETPPTALARLLARLHEVPVSEQTTVALPAELGGGEEVDAEVVDVEAGVATVRTIDGRRGLLLKDDLSWTRKVRDLRRLLRPGQLLRGLLVGEADGLWRFSVRALEDDPWPEVEGLVDAGPVGGTVFSWQPRIGLFVTLEGSRVNGLVPRSTLEDDAHFEVGTGVLVEVRGVDRDAREVELAFLGTRPESPEALIGHRPGERLVGTVTHVEPARGYALVALPDGFTAILPAPRLSPAGRSALLSGKVRVGDRVPVVVAEVDARRRRIELTDPIPERRAIRHPTFAAGEHDVRVEVGRRLRALRTQAGMTQVQLATRAAVHPTQVAHVEGGRTNPSLWTIVRLARALDLDPSELIGGLVPADDEVSP